MFMQSLATSTDDVVPEVTDHVRYLGSTVNKSLSLDMEINKTDSQNR